MRPILCVLGGVFAANLAVAALAAKADPTRIRYEEAKPILEAHHKQISAAEWPAWAAKRNAEIRARLAQGDEDSIVNLWLYGTSFTKLPRVTDRQVTQLANREAIEDLLVARLDDFVSAVATPGTNERLQFARDLIAAKGFNLRTETGRENAKIYLVGVRERVVKENEQYRRASQSTAEYATLFQGRGLSSDTRVTASFAVDKALAALAASGRVPAGGVRRVAIVGPGLDFTDKAEGYDFYPQQTIQPFAVIDSLVRAGLAKGAGIHVTTLDLSPRVNRHLDAARRRAGGYVIQLPLARDDTRHQWHPDLVAYWRTFGGSIGAPVKAIAPPAIAGDVQVRAVSVRPAVVTAVVPQDVNIVLERSDGEPFDLIVATNILVYYDQFEQSLALANISKMLKPGGFFLTNYAVTPMAPMETTASLTTPVFFDKQQNGDTIYCYRRR